MATHLHIQPDFTPEQALNARYQNERKRQWKGLTLAALFGPLGTFYGSKLAGALMLFVYASVAIALLSDPVAVAVLQYPDLAADPEYEAVAIGTKAMLWTLWACNLLVTAFSVRGWNKRLGKRMQLEASAAAAAKTR